MSNAGSGEGEFANVEIHTHRSSRLEELVGELKFKSHPSISLDIVQWPEQLLNHFYLDTVIALFVCGAISLIFCQLRQGAEYKLVLS